MTFLTEDRLALDFTNVYPDYRWVESWRAWYRWNGKYWENDTTLGVYDQIRGFLRENARDAKNWKQLRKASSVAAVERLTRSDRQYAATHEQWDYYSMLLNTPRCIVDLRSRQLIAHDPVYYMTKISGTGPSDQECPQWLAFLDDVTDGDAELIRFLQRVAGYCLTGDTSEHALFFLHGTGANGKSTFLNVLTACIGDYATTAPMETFTTSKYDRHPTELAMLRGARLVTATETEEGRRWAESRIKQLTGGDRISARFMRQDFFQFSPTFKLLIAGNHKPRLNAVDEAMRRRFHLIPFEASFRGRKRIKDMEERLKEELAAIMQWAIDGCIAWQEQGLKPPERVRAATQAYFTNQDIFGEWLSECCQRGPDFWETPTRLFNSWREFAKSAHYSTGTKAVFNDRMESFGFHRDKDWKQGRKWVGLKLNPDELSQEWAA